MKYKDRLIAQENGSVLTIYPAQIGRSPIAKKMVNDWLLTNRGEGVKLRSVMPRGDRFETVIAYRPAGAKKATVSHSFEPSIIITDYIL